MGFASIGMAVGGITALLDILVRIYNWAKHGLGFGGTICDFFGVGCDGLMPDWKGLNEIFIWFFNAPLSITGIAIFFASLFIFIHFDDMKSH